MIPVQDGRQQPPELEQNIRDGISQRTKVRIQTLEVELLGDRVVVRGCVPCYYLKQLVLQGVLDVMGLAGASRIELNIQVVAGPSKLVDEVTP